MSILKILEELGSNTTKTWKTSVLEKHKANTQFISVVRMALDPYLNFYIRKIPEYATSTTPTQTIDWAMAQLEKLSSRELTGYAGIEHLRTILSSLSADDATVISRIIGKDLRCGVADGLVNAVSPGLIPTYPCLLARPYEAKNIKNIEFPAYSQLKADGLRVNVQINGTAISICGRSGRDIDLFDVMDAEWIKLGQQFDVPVVIDGELVVVDANGKVLPRKIGNGIINKAIKGTISREEAKMVRAQIWDVIPLSEFKAGISKKKYSDRLTALEVAIKAITPPEEDQTVAKLAGKPATLFWLIPGKIVKSLDEAIAHFNELLASGEEGTILKNFCGLWEDTRSKHLVKLKAEEDCDLEIIGWNPGEGKFLGQVGSLICASSDRKVIVSISGFSDALRLQITKDINELIGTIITVIYNERISSQQNVADSLFLPRFAEFRTDKTVANSSAEIK